MKLTLAPCRFTKPASFLSRSKSRFLFLSWTVFFSSKHSFKMSSFHVKLASKFLILEALKKGKKNKRIKKDYYLLTNYLE